MPGTEPRSDATAGDDGDRRVADLVARVRAAAAAGEALQIQGGSTKAFYGEPPTGTPLPVGGIAGIVAYEPTELYLKARCGTPLAEVETALAGSGQVLAFEPPHFGDTATVGGCVAAGLAGPRRATAGGVRDYVLGVTLLDGRGDVLHFGGNVMKNVAGYDVARALAGSLGILGVLLDVTLKVLPRPPEEATLRFAVDETTALARLNQWGGLPLPLSASAWHDGVLHLRLSGAVAAVQAARRQLGGDVVERADADAFWRALREQQHAFFGGGAPLWRVSVPSTAPALGLDAPQLIEWGGAQRWLRTSAPAASLRARVASVGGHATRFRGGSPDGAVFTTLAPPVAAIHRRLKEAFDPQRIFNRGRMYPDL
ncbi:MAG TPA: glycolate oxidase subunit GlcE [Burkholderiaceae bacterium]|nr:glycolate oxidase subunit GlcE [Burkholderiaceae bacterium]